MNLATLTNNTPPAPVLTSSATQQTLPDWYNTFLQTLATRGTDIASQAYQPYTGPRVAGFSPLQQQGFSQLTGAANSGQGGLAQAQQMIGGVPTAISDANAAASGAAAGATGAATTFGTGAADAAAAAAQAAQGAATTFGSGAVGAATQAGTNAQGALGQFGPQSVEAARAAAETANTSFGGPAQTFPGQVAQYMSPYTSSVVAEIARLGNRNFEENIMPGVMSSFVASGQPGSTRHAEIFGRAARDTQADITGRQAMALESGYRTAADIFGADANRAAQRDGQRASTALQGGQLVSGALGQMAQLGANTAIQSGQLATNANLGAGNMNLDASLRGGQLSSGALQQLAQLVSSSRLQGGQLEAGTALQGGQLGVSGANSMAQIAQLQQQLGIGGANALLAGGATQQGNQQQGLDTAYRDYLDQRGFDMGQLGQLRSLIAGMQIPGGATTVQSSPGTDYGASPLAWLSSLLQQPRP